MLESNHNTKNKVHLVQADLCCSLLDNIEYNTPLGCDLTSMSHGQLMTQ